MKLKYHPNIKYLLDKYNLKTGHLPLEIPNTNREDLAKLFNELGFTSGVEVGVESGAYSEILCKNNPKAKLYAIDAWTAYEGYVDHVSQERLDSLYETAKARLKQYNCEVIKGFSSYVVKQFEDKSLDFVYIDHNHALKPTIDALFEWIPKVKVGGIISGHDYIRSVKFTSTMHVVEALHAFVKSYKIDPLFVLGDKNKKEGEKRDKQRSWFFVKPDYLKV